MQDYVFMDHDRVVEIDDSIEDLSTIAYSELVAITSSFSTGVLGTIMTLVPISYSPLLS
jgi:hypothetical protein